MKTIQCPLCDRVSSGGGGPHDFFIKCVVCGSYELRDFFNPREATDGLSAAQRASLSHFARTRWDRYESWTKTVPRDETRKPPVPLIDATVVNQARRGELLQTRAQQAANAIRHIGDQLLRDGEHAQIPLDPASLAAMIGAPSSRSAENLMMELHEARLVRWSPAVVYTPDRTGDADLTLQGWERYEDMIHGSPDGGYGFFAWEFGSDSTERIFQEVLKPAFEARGYPLKDMNDLGEPGLIDNIMQAKIRSASFVIVDLTDHNHGAYWEGGFAQALNKPVVYIMHHPAFEAKKPHFDTNHYTIIFWGEDGKTDEQFVESLMATLGRHSQLDI